MRPAAEGTGGAAGAGGPRQRGAAAPLGPFRNEPNLELRRAPVREGLLGALDELDRRLPLRVPVLVGEERGSHDGIESTDPGAPGRVVAVAGRASQSEVDAAVEAAGQARAEWGGLPATERAATLLRAAEALRSRRHELAALAVRESAKPWPEADADVCEAIDYLEYYARGAVELAAGRPLIQVPGERNELRHSPRGVAAVISPWNFPLAIPCGMAAAALATGNAVVLKPAEQSPGCALALVEALREAGVPPRALALLPGLGDTGAALVRHPGVHTIAFTGSSAVGLEIVRAAAEVPPGRRHVKRAIAEMGGKNCVIVDSDADLDQAVPEIVASAYHYAGQKCSAAARALVHEAVADDFERRLAGAVEVLVVGQAERFGTEVPPLIEREARERVERYRERAAREGRELARAAELPPGDGWFCAPAAVADLPPDSPVVCEEVFGPLLTVERVKSVDEACDRVEALPFALTAGLFSRSPRTVERAAARLPAGNLYINRRTTGAVVGRQPFGGNRLSGIGPHAGGPDYLLQFTDSHTLTENTLRHGLAVDAKDL